MREPHTLHTRDSGYPILIFTSPLPLLSDLFSFPPHLQANREAPTLVFASARGEVNRINTTQAMVAQHTPRV